ncbi:MAG: hypothetical protein KIS77_00440 [Saprospiraceae bacterium]|nr:hypothetical protein [Saprospiraceae bacterium]
MRDGSPDDFADGGVLLLNAVVTVTVVFRAWTSQQEPQRLHGSGAGEDEDQAVRRAASVTVSCESFDPSLWAYGRHGRRQLLPDT